MAKTIRVAIVGGGGGGLAQIQYFRAIGDVEIIRIMDPSPDEVAGRYERWGNRLPIPPVTDNLNEILHDPLVDLVSVCTPDATHADFSVAAFEAGKHVVAEKPLSNSRSGCKQILDAWKQSGKVGAVQHQFRFEPWCAKVVELVREGAIGSVVSVHGEYVHNLRERSRIHHPWRFDGPDAHAAMPAAGVHFIDLFRWLVNSEITEVSAIGNRVAFPEYPDSDCILSNVRFENGVIGRIMVNIGVEHPPHFPLRVFGTKGTLSDGYLICERTMRRVLNNPVRPKESVGFQTILRLPSRIMRKAKRTVRKFLTPEQLQSPFPGKLWQMEYQHGVACTESLRNVIEAIRNNRQPLVTIEEGAKACEAAFTAMESARGDGSMRRVERIGSVNSSAVLDSAVAVSAPM